VNDPESRCHFPDERQTGWWAWLTKAKPPVSDDEICETGNTLDEVEYLIHAATYDNPVGADP
jgi:hypothetical protein